MPVHDCGAVYEDYFHCFALSWLVHQKKWLNERLGPDGYHVLIAPTFYHPSHRAYRRIDRDRLSAYARRQQRLSVFDAGSRLIATVELPEPALKRRRVWLKRFVHRVRGLIRDGVSCAMADLPPARQECPGGVHSLIWRPWADADFPTYPMRASLTVGYRAGAMPEAVVRVAGPADPLPDLPVFLPGGLTVDIPLEATYQAAWADQPEPVRKMIAPSAG